MSSIFKLIIPKYNIYVGNLGMGESEIHNSLGNQRQETSSQWPCGCTNPSFGNIKSSATFRWKHLSF